jgi:hypothetical protein
LYINISVSDSDSETYNYLVLRWKVHSSIHIHCERMLVVARRQIIFGLTWSYFMEVMHSGGKEMDEYRMYNGGRAFQ